MMLSELNCWELYLLLLKYKWHDIDGADVNDADESNQDDNRVTADEGFKALEVSSSQFICNSIQFQFHYV
jgi:hypothetical protein